MKDRFSIWRKTNSVWILRNKNLELEIHTKFPELVEKYLRSVLPKDYEEYLAAYDIDYSVHTSEWFLNHIKTYIADEDGFDIKDFFTRSVPRGLKEKIIA